MKQATPGRRRRRHDDAFKARVVEACKVPGISMASVALSNGINANLLRRWVVSASADATARQHRLESPSGDFIQLPMPVAPLAPREPIRVEVQRGATTVAVTWPASAADACAAWLRDLLR